MMFACSTGLTTAGLVAGIVATVLVGLFFAFLLWSMQR